MSAPFLKSCCRVCLVQEHIMIYLYDRVDEFEMSLAELLETCANLKITATDDHYSKLICKECTEELLMVAKFREKCRTSAQTLNELTLSLNEAELEKLAATEDCQLVFDGMLDAQNIELNEAASEAGDIALCVQPEQQQHEPLLESSELQEVLEPGECQVPDECTFMEHEDDALSNAEDDEIFGAIIEEEAVEQEDDIAANNNYEALVIPSEEFYTATPPELQQDSRSECSATNDSEFSAIASSGWSATADRQSSTVINHHCELCGAGFMILNNLRKHLQSHVDDNGTVPESNSIEMAEETANLAAQSFRELYECATCTMMFTNPAEFQQHCATHQPEVTVDAPPQPDRVEQIFQIPQPPAQRPKMRLKRSPNPAKSPGSTPAPCPSPAKSGQVERPAAKEHPCPLCSRTFKSNSLLLAHTRIHTGDKPFECTSCPKAFATRGGLDLHMRRHLGVKPFACQFCDRRFVENSNLRVHMRIHTGEKPHKCNRCERSFSRVFLLQIHQRTHTGEKPYGCDVCDKRFAQQGDLAAHKRIHTGERPHHCSICGRGFIKSSALRPHMRMHERNAEEATANRTTEESGAMTMTLQDGVEEIGGGDEEEGEFLNYVAEGEEEEEEASDSCDFMGIIEEDRQSVGGSYYGNDGSDFGVIEFA